MSLKTIFIGFILGLGVWYFLKTRELKDYATQAAARHCQNLSLELLDQTVMFSRVRVARSKQGKWCLFREYGFEFSSTGEDRYHGIVKLRGRKVEAIELEAHRVE